MLMAHAPRAWCKRLLSWEVFSADLRLYAAAGEIVRLEDAASVLENAGLGPEPTPAELANLGEEQDAHVLRAARAAYRFDKVEVSKHPWDGLDFGPLPFGLLPLADVDWELGTLTVEINESSVPFDWLSSPEELFEPGERETLVGTFSELSFELSAMEMLAPGANSPQPTSKQITTPSKRIGRPAKWDWEGALTHVTALANLPDGLPEGSGAQAQVARLINDWFVANTGDAPAESEVRKRASMIMGALEAR